MELFSWDRFDTENIHNMNYTTSKQTSQDTNNLENPTPNMHISSDGAVNNVNTDHVAQNYSSFIPDHNDQNTSKLIQNDDSKSTNINSTNLLGCGNTNYQDNLYKPSSNFFINQNSLPNQTPIQIQMQPSSQAHIQHMNQQSQQPVQPVQQNVQQGQQAIQSQQQSHTHSQEVQQVQQHIQQTQQVQQQMQQNDQHQVQNATQQYAETNMSPEDASETSMFKYIQNAVNAEPHHLKPNSTDAVNSGNTLLNYKEIPNDFLPAEQLDDFQTKVLSSAKKFFDNALSNYPNIILSSNEGYELAHDPNFNENQAIKSFEKINSNQTCPDSAEGYKMHNMEILFMPTPSKTRTSNSDLNDSNIVFKNDNYDAHNASPMQSKKRNGSLLNQGLDDDSFNLSRNYKKSRSNKSDNSRVFITNINITAKAQNDDYKSYNDTKSTIYTSNTLPTILTPADSETNMIPASIPLTITTSSYRNTPKQVVIRKPRKFPSFVPINENFPRYYNRFPIPMSVSVDHLDLSNAVCRSGIPHTDLYSPRYTRGRGKNKEALCPLCIVPVSGGGEGKETWLKTKYSAYWYHMNFYHGISSTTKEPYSPPIAFKMEQVKSTPRKSSSVLKHVPDRSDILLGKCHQCETFVLLQGPKDVNYSVPELFWFKHAQKCHKSRIEGEENDFFFKAVEEPYKETKNITKTEKELTYNPIPIVSFNTNTKYNTPDGASLSNSFSNNATTA